MDGEQRGDLLVAGIAGIEDLQIGRDQPRLPVVGVQQIDGQIQQADCLQHGPREEDEPLAIIDIILAVGRVELLAVEILVLLDEIDGHGAPACGSAGHSAASKAAADHLAADGNDKLAVQPLDRLAAILGLPVAGQDNGHLVA